MSHINENNKLNVNINNTQQVRNKGELVNGHSCQTFNHHTIPLSKDHYHLLFQIWIEQPDWSSGFPYKYMWLEHQTAPICDSSSTIRAFFHLKGSRKLKRKKKKNHWLYNVSRSKKKHIYLHLHLLDYKWVNCVMLYNYIKFTFHIFFAC